VWKRKLLRAPVASAQRSEQGRAVGLVEEEEVDLVRVLVLHDAPREAPRIEEIGVEPDLIRDRLRVDASHNVDRDLLRDDAPVETAHCERARDL
jgi:hypothetical protein